MYGGWGVVWVKRYVGEGVYGMAYGRWHGWGVERMVRVAACSVGKGHESVALEGRKRFWLVDMAHPWHWLRCTRTGWALRLRTWRAVTATSRSTTSSPVWWLRTSCS